MKFIAVAYLMALVAVFATAIQANGVTIKSRTFTLVVFILLVSGIVLAVGQL